MIMALLTPKLAKFAAMAAVAALAFYYVWDMGRDSERAKWEAEMRAERDRQIVLLDEAREYGAAAATALEAAEVERGDLLRRMQNEARNSANAGAACLDADGVMRLNSISRQ